MSSAKRRGRIFYMLQKQKEYNERGNKAA